MKSVGHLPTVRPRPRARGSRLPVTINGHTGVVERAFGGGLEGAERTSRETIRWTPAMGSPDQIIGRAKPLADMRGRDMMQNDGYAKGAVSVHQDSVVGAQYRLNCQPDMTVLNGVGGRSSAKFDEEWLKELREVVEARFNLIGESESCWLDAAGMNTFTGLCRLAVGGYVWTGEVLGTAEWLRGGNRPLSTAVQMVSPQRLSNPDKGPDTRTLRRGVQRDIFGRPLSYWIQNGYPTETYDGQTWTWKQVPATKPWGRKQVLHIIEQREADQSRGIADMVSALKHMRMTKNLSEITLQNAVVQASYAAAIESELPPEAVAAMMGQGSGPENFMAAIGTYMTAMQAYIGASNGIMIDGVKVPHLFPGTKFQARQLGTPGGIGQNFEASLLRHTAAALGMSYEEFARDYSKVSYSSARASANNTGRFMKARKKMVADRFANQVFQLVFEEEMAAGNVPLPRGVTREYFYVPLMKEAFTACTWTGSGTGQIDELKETQAAILRIKAGLSTYEIEVAKFGNDWRKIFDQIAREQGVINTLKLGFSLDAQKSQSGASTQGTLNGNDSGGNDDGAGDDGGDEGDE